MIVEGHERYHVPPRRVRHRLLTGNLPLHGGGERRELSSLDKALQLVVRHVGSCPVRHCWCFLHRYYICNGTRKPVGILHDHR
jgi:hypothetical protein